MAKYQVTKKVENKQWEVGDIVEVSGKTSSTFAPRDVLVPYTGDEPHKHILVVVEPITL